MELFVTMDGQFGKQWTPTISKDLKEPKQDLEGIDQEKELNLNAPI